MEIYSIILTYFSRYHKKMNYFSGVYLILALSVCTYIIGPYNPSVRIIDLVMLCVLIFIDKWRALQFKTDSERKIFLRIFLQNTHVLEPSLLSQIAL